MEITKAVNFGKAQNRKISKAMETYNLLSIGYSKDMDSEDAEVLDIIRRIDYEVKRKEQREMEKNKPKMRR